MIVTVFCVEHVAVVLENNRKRSDARYLGTRELFPSIWARLMLLFSIVYNLHGMN